MPPRLLLVRHGSTDYNSTRTGDAAGERLRGWVDVPLNAEGLADVKRVARALRSEPIAKIYSSDLRRAAVMARSIARENSESPSLETTRKLRPWDVGKWGGQPVEDVLDEMLRLQCEDTDEKAPGGESFDDFLRRFLPFAKDRMEEAKDADGPLVIVSHTRNLRAIDGWLKAGMKGLEVDPEIMSKKDHLHTGEGLELSFNDGKWSRKAILPDPKAKREAASSEDPPANKILGYLKGA